MQGAPYQEFGPDQLILRDYLAAARTMLANERTLLAYVRTALSVVLAGAVMIRFGETGALQWAGWALIPVSGLMLLIGVWRFRQVFVYIRHVERPRDAVAADPEGMRPSQPAKSDRT